MVRIIVAAVVALAAVVFALQSAKAYEAPWCAVTRGVMATCIGTASIARSKNADRMCWRAIVAGAIQARTSSLRIRRQNVGPTASVIPARSEAIG